MSHLSLSKVICRAPDPTRQKKHAETQAMSGFMIHSLSVLTQSQAVRLPNKEVCFWTWRGRTSITGFVEVSCLKDIILKVSWGVNRLASLIKYLGSEETKHHPKGRLSYGELSFFCFPWQGHKSASGCPHPAWGNCSFVNKTTNPGCHCPAWLPGHNFSFSPISPKTFSV